MKKFGSPETGGQNAVRKPEEADKKVIELFDMGPPPPSIVDQLGKVLDLSLLLRVVVLSTLVYFLCMDTILFTTFRALDFANEPKTPVKPWSPFHPLSMKLLMSDHVIHYVLTPLSEGFNDVTHFSEVFYFITPNMISFTHMGVGLLACRFFIYSDSLKKRRIGVLLCFFRLFLDALDGTVYRSRSSSKLFTSDHSSFGYVIDSVTDTAFTTVFFVSIFLFFIWIRVPAKEANALPWNFADGKGVIGTATENHETSKNTQYSAIYYFLRFLWYGAMVGISAAIWDDLHTKFTEVFMAKLKPPLAEVQLECFHSMSTWVMAWCWKVLQGQALVTAMLLAIFLDKIWEWAQLTKYLGPVLITALSVFSYYHLNNVRQLLHL